MIKKEIDQNQTENTSQCQGHCHCPCCHQYQDAYPSHNPFLIRQWIVASGIISGFLGGYLGFLVEWNCFGYYLVGCFPLLGLAFYFCCVTVGDFLSHFVLKLKPSSFSDESLLLKIEGVTAGELDDYFDTRRHIRILSLVSATAVFGVFWYFVPSYALVAFCTAYILSTTFGILFVRCTSSKRRPRIVRLDNRYYRPAPPFSGHNYLLWQQGELPYWW